VHDQAVRILEKTSDTGHNSQQVLVLAELLELACCANASVAEAEIPQMECTEKQRHFAETRH
jgi:hypothetical protein